MQLTVSDRAAEHVRSKSGVINIHFIPPLG
jgi:hypothetical protein